MKRDLYEIMQVMAVSIIPYLLILLATHINASHNIAVGELPVVEGKVGCPVPGNHGRYVNGAIYALTYTTGVSVTVQTNSEGTLWGYGIRFGNNEKHQIIQPFSACFLYKRLT